MNSLTVEKTYVDELNEIAKLNDGILRPEDVIEYARNKNTELHSRFNWDDDEAAHLWRLHQARNLIRIVVSYEKHSGKICRAWVSLSPDRDGSGGGYRSMVTVLSNEEMRARLLSDAKEELEVFKEKYSVLKELAKVFEAIESL